MSMTYSNLAKKLQSLEKQFSGNSTHTYSGGAQSQIRPLDNCQFFALDNSTSPASDKELPVVVAIGSNYTQGNETLPNKQQARVLQSKPYVEDDLLRERANLNSFLGASKNGTFAQKQEGCAKDIWRSENSPIDMATNAGQIVNSSEEYHLVMTNFSPWITLQAWSHYRDNTPEIVHELVSDGLAKGHLKALHAQLGSVADLWIGHGFFDVYFCFRWHVVNALSLKLGQWAFTSSLAFPPTKRSVWS